MISQETGSKVHFKLTMKLFIDLSIKIKSLIKQVFFTDSELTKDIVYILKKLNFNKPIFCDVGAYQGEWISKYLRNFPNLIAYLIEPHEKSYLYLKKKFKNYENIRPFKLGLSNSNEIQKVNINSKSYTNSFLEFHKDVSKSWKYEQFENLYKEESKMQKLSDFVRENNISKINVLKLDVQGYESRVLNGAADLLEKNLIDLILLEVIIIPTYKNQSKVSEIFDIFENYKYSLYGVYDIEKNPKRSRLQQFDALFFKSSLNL